LNVNLVKTSALNGIAVLVKMLTLLGINKVLAVLVGPTGYALVGQFQNAVQMITTFSSGAINTGVTKYTAEESQNETFLQDLWRTASTIAISGALITASLVAIFSQNLSLYFLKNANLYSVFLWFAASLVFFVLNTLLLAILNGKKELKTYVIANIAGSILALLFTVVLTYYFGLTGALVALGTYQSVAFVLTLSLTARAPWFKKEIFFGKIDPAIARKLFHFTLMALTSAVCAPLSHIFIRNFIGSRLSWTEAGEWEAMWRLSSAYLMFYTSTLSVYFLPRLAELKNSVEVRTEIKQCLKIILPFLVIGSIAVYLLRDLVIKILFSSEFLGIDQLFALQLTGDTFKIISWILAYVMLAKGMTFDFIISEIIFSFSFYFLIVLLLPKYGLLSTAMAHLINYLAYLIFVYAALKRRKVI
jgi:PST family polysaccharide transporter